MPEMETTPLEVLTGNELLLVLTARPGDETECCGALIAACCARGRAPTVMVLGDGSSRAAPGMALSADALARRRDRETRAAVACLGLSAEHVLMAGLYDGTIPGEGARFEAIVRAVTLVMWRRDCNVIVSPWPGAGRDRAGWAEVDRIAAAVARGSGVGRLAFGAGEGGMRFEGSGVLAAKRAARAAHGSSPSLGGEAVEWFLRPSVG